MAFERPRCWIRADFTELGSSLSDSTLMNKLHMGQAKVLDFLILRLSKKNPEGYSSEKQKAGQRHPRLESPDLNLAMPQTGKDYGKEKASLRELVLAGACGLRFPPFAVTIRLCLVMVDGLVLY